MSAAVHHSPYAGSWYPSDPAVLQALLDELLAKSEARAGSSFLPGPLGFVVPHAGLVYSGSVAATAYRHFLADRPERIILLGFAHRGAPPGALIPRVDAYSTPLGVVRVDGEASARLLAGGAFQSSPEPVLCDHSVEIQLPLLQRTAPGAQVLPIYVSSLDEESRRRAARSLGELLEPGTVLLASSDFTHYGDTFGYKPFPHNKETPARLRALDEEFIEAVGSLDPEFLLRTLRSQHATVCGREPIALLLETLRGLADRDDYFQQSLDYETSGDVTGDWSHCVSYAALAFHPWPSFQLPDNVQRVLLDSARRTLRHYQETGLREPCPPETTSPEMTREAGAFVTLKQKGRLRGCVGRLAGSAPLHGLIPDLTLAAALDDSRFEPLATDEEDIDIEISVLSPLKRLPDPARFRVGLDGGYLTLGPRSGLLLPQVAEGRDWNADEFLQALARKAGVPGRGCDDPDARLYVFRAQHAG